MITIISVCGRKLPRKVRRCVGMSIDPFDLKTKFMLALCNGRGQSVDVAAIEMLAADLAARCARSPAGDGLEPLTERDQRVLGVLKQYLPGFHAGMRPSEWKAACAREGVCARRAWESSLGRLLAHGLVAQHGARFVLANSSAG